MSRFIVGLRGGIGTGKSTVSDLFADRGIVIADADVSARKIVEPGQPAFHEILAHFGDDILAADGTLDRPRLREHIFANADDKLFLEQTTQRRIVEDLMNIVATAPSAYSILVLSTGSGKVMGMNRLLVVDAPEALQIERVMARDNNSRELVGSIMAQQPSREARVAEADDLIVNDGDLERLKLEVDRLHQLYLSLARDTQESHG